ncbi:methyltransferase domain-containing protein [Candidatus Uhrbacteria bacterium]|nr:methyltransferase domain-containing protein [Candidatus Uhrbacteria bacterium]
MHHTGTALLDPQVILDYIGIQPGWHVIDLGCGALGHFTIPAARSVGGSGKVYAVDIQKSALEAIARTARQEQLWNVHPIWSNIEIPQATPIRSHTAHLTLMVNLLHQTTDRSGAMQEAARLTMPEGLILVIDWNAELTVLGPSVDQRVFHDQIQALAQDAGLNLSHQFPAGDHHGAWLFQREEVTSPEATILHQSHPFHTF